MLKLGDELLGVVAMKIEKEDIDTSLLNINLFPFKIFIEKLHDMELIQFRINIFNKITIGTFICLNREY